MNFCNFETTTFGKWILAGEHAVVRGHQALVFPVKSRQLTFQYKACATALRAEFSGNNGADLHLLFWSVLEQCASLLGKSLNQISGEFYLENSIPIGVGMGASAALCVAMSRWICAQNMIEASQSNEFARELEHLFHGKSSGLDIAGVASNEGVSFQAGICKPLKQSIQPHWYLSSCNQVGITSHCIQQVEALWSQNKILAQQIDYNMEEAVKESKQALAEGGSDAIKRLAKAMNKACQCFFQWGLVSESLQQHMSQLQLAGAIAVKPTGSGGGGYVLSLWLEEPPLMNFELIAV